MIPFRRGQQACLHNPPLTNAMTVDLPTILGVTSLLVTFAAIIASHVRNSARIDFLSRDNDDMKKLLNSHSMNTAIHMDPVRDEQRWGDLVRRLDRIEGKLDPGPARS